MNDVPAPFAHVFGQLEKVRSVKPGLEWEARCPAHEDKRPSLTLKLNAEGNLLVHCHRNNGEGCPAVEIMTAVGCTLEDLFKDNKRYTGGGYKVDRTGRKQEAVYEYRDENRRLLFQVVRYRHPDGRKEFAQRQPNPNPDQGPWLWSITNCRRVIYRLPDLLEAAQFQRVEWVRQRQALGESVRQAESSFRPRVVVVEGEKAAEALWGVGVPATCNAGGAGKWQFSDYAALKGWDAAVLPDNDPYDPREQRWVGQDHAEDVCRRLHLLGGCQVKYVDLPDLPIKGDAYDWVQSRRAVGRTPEQIRGELWAVVHDAPPWVPPDQPHPLYARAERLAAALAFPSRRTWTREVDAAAEELADDLADWSRRLRSGNQTVRETLQRLLPTCVDRVADLAAVLLVGSETFLEVRRRPRRLPVLDDGTSHDSDRRGEAENGTPPAPGERHPGKTLPRAAALQ
jgi:putative DNA primase/helicase